MHEIDKAHFGAFIQGLRRERGLTQAQLAQRVFVSDKAVSKWERGLSLPDISLLMPLAEALGVTVIELLEGRRVALTEPIAAAQAENLVQRAITLSDRQGQRVGANRGRNALIFGLCLLLTLAEIALLLALGYPAAELTDTVLLLTGMCAGFGAYFWLLVKERLPAYYDENPIAGYMDGPVRLNLPGLRLSNRNWPRIVKAARASLTAMMVGYPLLYLAVNACFPRAGALIWRTATLVTLLSGLFIPIYAAGKKHS